MGKPFLPNITPIIQAGIDPKTGLPIKLKTQDGSSKEEIKRFLRIIDEQDAVNRYVWYNLPCNITSQELERFIYLKGQLCFFYLPETEEFYFMPYALDGGLDFYGRYKQIHPVPFNGGNDKDSAIVKYLTTVKRIPVYSIKVDDVSTEEMDNSCVLLYDYSKQLSETIIPRSVVNEPLLDTMSEIIPFMRTSLIAGTGIKGVRVQDADQEACVAEGSRSLTNAALTGKLWVPLLGSIDFQELTDGQVTKSEEYMLAMQSLDNFRLSGYGIDNGGLFEKKAHELQTEADINGGPVGLVLQDGLSIRQNFCNIVNSIWGLGIWCEPAENIMGADLDGDGLMYDENDSGENSGVTNDEL